MKVFSTEGKGEKKKKKQTIKVVETILDVLFKV